MRTRDWAAMFRVSVSPEGGGGPGTARARPWRIPSNGSRPSVCPCTKGCSGSIWNRTVCPPSWSRTSTIPARRSTNGKQRVLFPGTGIPQPDRARALPFDLGRKRRDGIPQNPGGAVPDPVRPSYPRGGGVLTAQRSPIPKKWRTAMRHTHPSATSRARREKRRTIPDISQTDEKIQEKQRRSTHESTEFL